jgi:hypothetical protein
MKTTRKIVLITLSSMVGLVAAVIWLVFFKLGIRFHIANIVSGGN